MKGTDSSQVPQLPPGFRFHPTDEELVVHYLKKKASSTPLPASIIAEIDLYKFDPWELPAKATFGEKEWYFFSPRDRKYPNGARPNRATTTGYWKATGTDKPVFTAGGTQKVGVKKALVFYGGKPPKGVKTNWIMHEFRLTEGGSVGRPPPAFDVLKNKGSLRLDDWVLCRIYKKSNTHRAVDTDDDGGGGSDLTMNMTMNRMMVSPPLYRSSIDYHGVMRPTGGSTGYNAITDTHEHHNILFDNMLNSNTNNISTSTLLPAKQSGMFWNEEGNTGNSSSSAAYTKIFLTETSPDGSPMDTKTMTTNDENVSTGSLIGGIPQLHQQTMLVAPGDGVFRQPYQLPDTSWYS